MNIKKLVFCLWMILMFGVALCPFSFADGNAKNVILMISDGQGIGIVMAADHYKGDHAVYKGDCTS